MLPSAAPLTRLPIYMARTTALGCCAGRSRLHLNRFALAIGAFPMLETARIGGDARFRRGVGQLGRSRSPKPVVAVRTPAAPANEIKDLMAGPSERRENVDPTWTQVRFTAAGNRPLT